MRRGNGCVRRCEHVQVYIPVHTHTHTHLVYAHVRYGCVTFIDVAMPLAPEVRLQHETLAETMIIKADGVCSHEASAYV